MMMFDDDESKTTNNQRPPHTTRFFFGMLDGDTHERILHHAHHQGCRSSGVGEPSAGCRDDDDAREEREGGLQ